MNANKRSEVKLTAATLSRFRIFERELKTRPIRKNDVPGILGLDKGQVDMFIYVFSLQYPLWEESRGRGRNCVVTYGLVGAWYESMYARGAQGAKQ